MNETNMEQTSFTLTEAQRRKLLDRIAAATVRGAKPSTYRDRVEQLVDSGMAPAKIDAALAKRMARQQTRSRRVHNLLMALAFLLFSLLACALISMFTLFVGADPKVQTAFQNTRGQLVAWLQGPTATATPTLRPTPTNTPTRAKPTNTPTMVVSVATATPTLTPVTPTPLPVTPSPTAVSYEAAWLFDPKWVEVLKDGQQVEHLGIGLPLTVTLKLSQDGVAASGVKISLLADTDLVYFPETVESLTTDDQGVFRDARFFGKRPGTVTLTAKPQGGREITTTVTFVPVASCQDTKAYRCNKTPLYLRGEANQSAKADYSGQPNEKFPLLSSCDTSVNYCLVWVGALGKKLYAFRERVKVDQEYAPASEAQANPSPATDAPTPTQANTPSPASTATAKPAEQAPPVQTYTASNPQDKDKVVFYLGNKGITPVLQLPDGGNVTLVTGDLTTDAFVRINVTFWVPSAAVVQGKLVAATEQQACWSTESLCGRLYPAADQLQLSKVDSPEGDWQKVELLLWLPANNLQP